MHTVSTNQIADILHFTDNHLIMGDFNMELNNLMVKSFLDSNNLTNLIKTTLALREKGRQLTSFSRTGNIHLSIHHHMKRDLAIIII